MSDRPTLVKNYIEPPTRLVCSEGLHRFAQPHLTCGCGRFKAEWHDGGGVIVGPWYEVDPKPVDSSTKA